MCADVDICTCLDIVMEMRWDALHGILVSDWFGSEACSCPGTLVLLLHALGAQWVFVFAGVLPKECFSMSQFLASALRLLLRVVSVDCHGLEDAS